MEDDPRERDASPYLVWEWLIVEALIRQTKADTGIRGVPGTLVTRRAVDQYGYVDARSYLKTPRIFGFHGVYKRLAIHLGIVDVHLAPGPNAERLAEAWANSVGIGKLSLGSSARREAAFRSKVFEDLSRLKRMDYCIGEESLHRINDANLFAE